MSGDFGAEKSAEISPDCSFSLQLELQKATRGLPICRASAESGKPRKATESPPLVWCSDGLITWTKQKLTSWSRRHDVGLTDAPTKTVWAGESRKFMGPNSEIHMELVSSSFELAKTPRMAFRRVNSSVWFAEFQLRLLRSTHVSTAVVLATSDLVDLELLSRKVLNYGVLMNTLTLLQLRSFLSQMRYHEEEHATVTKLSALGIAMQALMDAYDSFLHLSVAAPVQVLNTYSFAVVSMLKFSLFALVEIRYLLLIWRHQNQHMFAEGWEAVRQELSRVYAQFYGALVSGLVLIFIASDYLDFVALLMQAYWLPQIVYDVRHGSKNSFTHFFVFSIAATRSLQFLYLFGCPAGIFDGEIYPHLPGAPSLELCLAAVVIQVAQVSVMISQRHLGPRWFVPWLCLPHVYNYRRHSQGSLQSECVICMLEIGPEDGVIATTPCEHRFHEACLERWMDVKMECPTCRRALPPM
ncbi:Transmembrane E3 ubiquitin-protein ligase FLY1 (Protein FLYING SAUCER 1) (RING-type E3 ubiquitin transferase FLY1) [Durusdinium trenchii]|uniref:RING-type E3 ubiquitin transferase n=1 Tax=Durusdinium trenchii TaxID=1381693 RepID=A0ABP0RJ70_9DINO